MTDDQEKTKPAIDPENLLTFNADRMEKMPGKTAHIISDLFVMFVNGSTLKQIATAFNLHINTVQKLRYKYDWDGRKAELVKKTNANIQEHLIEARNEQIRIALALAKTYGAKLLQKVADDKVDVKATDYLALIKVIEMLTTENAFGINLEKSIASKTSFVNYDQVIAKLSPEERKLILNIDEKLKKAQEEDRRGKESIINQDIDTSDYSVIGKERDKIFTGDDKIDSVSGV